MLTAPSFARKLSFACLAFFSVLLSSAQTALPDFGQAFPEELNMKECSFDKSADAVILLDHAVASFNQEYNLITERRIRIKILKEKGLRRADVRIPFYSADDFEFISAVNAVVLTPNGNGGYTATALEHKNIFTQKVNQLQSTLSFALPNVKVGSIIDYTYQSTMKSYAGLRNWEFQSDIPVVTSWYELAPIPNSEFAYSVHKSPELPIKITPDNANGKIRFVMNDIPGLRDEVFTTSTDSYLQRVNFQIASYKNYYGQRKFTDSWPKLASELLDNPDFGSQINKDLSGLAFLKSVSPTLSATEKLKTIFEFVRDNMVWNHISSKYTESSVKSVLEKKKGNSGDINLLLISLLKSAGIEVYPLLVSERHHGLVDTTYSYLDQFNTVMAYAVCEGKAYVLDGTDLSTPFFMIPSDILNTTGFLVDKKKSRFVHFANLPHQQREYINIVASVHDDGLLEGTAMVKSSEYAKLQKQMNFHNEQSRYREALLKGNPFVKLDSFALNGLKDDSAALKEDLAFHYTLKQSGGYYLLNANLFTGMNENPFTTQYRFTDIDFGSKYSGIVTAAFLLPSSFTTDALPQNKRLVSPDKSMSVSRLIQKTDNLVSVRYNIDISREKYKAEEFDDVRLFFREMIEMLNEPILIKAK